MGCVSSSMNIKDIKTTRELAKALLKIFDKIDSDKSGVLSQRDLNAYFKGPNMQEHTHRLFAQFDLDKDGLITKREWLTIWQMLQRFGDNQLQVCLTIQRLNEGILDLSNTQIDSLHNDEIIQQMIGEVGKQLEGYLDGD